VHGASVVICQLLGQWSGGPWGRGAGVFREAASGAGGFLGPVVPGAAGLGRIGGFVGNFVIGHWSLVIGHWSFVIGHWSLVIGHWSLVRGAGGGSRIRKRRGRVFGRVARGESREWKVESGDADESLVTGPLSLVPGRVSVVVGAWSPRESGEGKVESGDADESLVTGPLSLGEIESWEEGRDRYASLVSGPWSLVPEAKVLRRRAGG